MMKDISKGHPILIVDDQDMNVKLLESLLRRDGYTRIMSTTDPRQAVQLCAMFHPDLIMLDLVMPHLDGLAVMEQLNPLVDKEGYLPILVLTADITPETRLRALEMGAKDFITKPFDASEVLLRTRNLLEMRSLYVQLREQNDELDRKVRERTRELEKSQVETLERLALAAEYHDDETGQHNRRVGRVSALIAQVLGLPPRQVELLRQAAPLHDIGKVGIPDDILLKPGLLTPGELEVMKTHTIVGAKILSGGTSELIRTAERIAMTHHERWDGAGYPCKLAGENIPIVGRIVAIADVFDALRQDRPYKKARSFEEAVAEIERQGGRQFDPAVVDAFLRVVAGEVGPIEPVAEEKLALLSGPLDVHRLSIELFSLSRE